ncbi:hypothetical protein D3C87_1547740 [compost metagenome]
MIGLPTLGVGDFRTIIRSAFGVKLILFGVGSKPADDFDFYADERSLLHKSDRIGADFRQQGINVPFASSVDTRSRTARECARLIGNHLTGYCRPRLGACLAVDVDTEGLLDGADQFFDIHCHAPLVINDGHHV